MLCRFLCIEDRKDAKAGAMLTVDHRVLKERQRDRAQQVLRCVEKRIISLETAVLEGQLRFQLLLCKACRRLALYVNTNATTLAFAHAWCHATGCHGRTGGVTALGWQGWHNPAQTLARSP